ncbi:MAG: sulfatase-like hydrolase/transferase, partial [Verrucomicrobiales bacterium]|nr:sulfatase-like hydrolase/transferase [Verrucomicrobiales bacterium]
FQPFRTRPTGRPGIEGVRPHLPIESDPEFMKLYVDLEDPEHRQHHGNITQIDYAFGRLMDALDAQGLRENTFVIFTSDNGPEGNGINGRTRGSTGGLRGRKRDSHEGGIRVPAIVRWPGKIEPGTVSETPVIGSDIFSTVLDIVDVPQPSDRTIDGVSMVPAFAGEELERPVPLFWRTHIAPGSSHAAMRIGEWKIVADKELTKFQLYQIEEDWKEESDLASAMPEKLEEMKSKFLEVWKDVEAEGPNEWWENDAKRDAENQTKKTGAKLKEGTDKSGDWDVVKGGTVEKSEFGYLLDAGSSEAVALKILETPIQESASFTLKFRTAKGTSKTRNAFFCFGSSTENDSLFKAGAMIGMNRHGFFEGGWANVKLGAGKDARFDPEETFEARITIDLEHGKAILTIGETTVEQELPDTLESVTHVGIYTKATRSEFTMPEAVQP